MFQRKNQFVAFCFTIAGLASVAEGGVTDLQPFTHVARISAGAELASIKLESVKAVKVSTRRTSVTNEQFCEKEYHEPGGSMYCPYTRDESPAPAYQVNYSYSGQPLASDEYGSTRFTFSVYLRPDELSPEARQTVSTGSKLSAADGEGFFKVTISRDTYRSVAIDEEKSAFCSGNYIDGNWTVDNPQCQARVVYKPVTTPSGYITVKVDPAPRRFEAATE